MSNLKAFLVLSDEVQEALEQNKPVVALEHHHKSRLSYELSVQAHYLPR